MSLFYASKCHHPICHQLNVAAMCRSKEYGAPVSPQEPGSWVENVDQQEMLEAFDGSGEVTALAGAQVAFEILTSMVKRGMDEKKGKTTASRDEL